VSAGAGEAARRLEGQLLTEAVRAQGEELARIGTAITRLEGSLLEAVDLIRKSLEQQSETSARLAALEVRDPPI
jgi:hypothetical protein